MAQDHPVLWGYLWQFVFACGFIVLIAAWLFIKRFPEILAAVRAAGWPVAQGRVETVAVKTLSGQALGELAYSYLAEGERYSGYLTRPFADERTRGNSWTSSKDNHCSCATNREPPASRQFASLSRILKFRRHHGISCGGYSVCLSSSSSERSSPLTYRFPATYDSCL